MASVGIKGCQKHLLISTFDNERHDKGMAMNFDRARGLLNMISLAAYFPKARCHNAEHGAGIQVRQAVLPHNNRQVPLLCRRTRKFSTSPLMAIPTPKSNGLRSPSESWL